MTTGNASGGRPNRSRTALTAALPTTALSTALTAALTTALDPTCSASSLRTCTCPQHTPALTPANRGRSAISSFPPNGSGRETARCQPTPSHRGQSRLTPPGSSTRMRCTPRPTLTPTLGTKSPSRPPGGWRRSATRSASTSPTSPVSCDTKSGRHNHVGKGC